MDPNIILKAHEISKAYYTPKPTQILRAISLTLRQGDSVAIMGRSGEGKTTLLHILGVLETPTEGTLEIAGQKVKKNNRPLLRNKCLGFIFQSFHLLEHYTVIENILMPAAIARQSIAQKSPAYERALHLLEKVGLSHRSHFQTKLLSGGEKQRTAIARALMNDPDIILADEPTGNLDHRTSQQIQDLLFSCLQEERKALIIVTHDYQLAGRCCRQFLLENGFLVMQKNASHSKCPQ